MARGVPDLSSLHEPARDIGEALDSLLEHTGAGGGWLAWRDASGQLQFPVRRGHLAEEWLSLQQARGHVWGFTIGTSPSLLSDLGPLPGLEADPLHNLLSCPLGPEPAAGTLVLVNKPHGFSAHDGAVLQGVAHLLYRKLQRAELAEPPGPPYPLPLWQRVLDRSSEGILIMDEAGVLLYANVTWQKWTGFSADELTGRPAPFPFWVSTQDLSRLHGRLPEPSGQTLPFRRRDLSLFWCRVEMVREVWEGRAVQVGFLHLVSERPAEAEPAETSLPLAADELPVAMGLVDRQNRLRWCNAAFRQLAAPGAKADQVLRQVFPPPLAAALEQTLLQAASAEPGQMGSSVLQLGGAPLTAYWLAVALSDGPGFLLALSDSPAGFVLSQPRGQQRPPQLPDVRWLVLLLGRAREGVRFWNERWQEITGLSPAEVQGQPAELVLDWLFPRQRDRERVADILQQQPPRGGQSVLEVLTPTGSRPLLCTFLPLVEQTWPASAGWLLLASEPHLLGETGGAGPGFVRQLAWGLRSLLQAHLRVPRGLSQILLDRGGLPDEVAGWLGQVVEGCRKLEPLLTDLAQLTIADAGPLEAVPLGRLVEAFCRERASAEIDYHLQLLIQDDEAVVRINPTLLRVVLQHLLLNAEQALTGDRPRRIEVRVWSEDRLACCEVRDTGEGLPAGLEAQPLLPFFSTKGPFARDPAHAAREATGLGLTVCQHLLSLMGGRLELRPAADGGTQARLLLPRVEPLRGQDSSSKLEQPGNSDGPVE
jgi:PAS domain S-box-containing protein